MTIIAANRQTGMPTDRAYSKSTTLAARLLGEQVRLARRQRRWTEAEAAERAGVARATLQKVERGDPGVAIGLAFELCAVLGVPLFGADPAGLAAQRERVADKLALLPRRVRKPPQADDDF